jgi:hypothetical protein
VRLLSVVDTPATTAVVLLQNAWPEMLQTLLNNVTGQFPEGTKCASLEALGYMCDDVSSSCQQQVHAPLSNTDCVDVKLVQRLSYRIC